MAMTPSPPPRAEMDSRDVGTSWTPEQIAVAGASELAPRRTSIEFAMLQIRNQLDTVEAREFNGSPEGRADWLRRANTKLRYLGFEHQQILRRLGELRREEKRSDEKRFERAFVEAAKAKLDPTTFNSLVALARAEMGGP